jgi:transcriptional regulator with XRE-family HTH domain
MEEQNVSRAELARRSGIHGGLIGRYLRREISIGLTNAPKLAKALGLSTTQVLGLEAPEAA